MVRIALPAPGLGNRQRRIERGTDAFATDHDVIVVDVQEMDAAQVVGQDMRSPLEHRETIAMPMPKEESRDLVFRKQIQDLAPSLVRLHVVPEQFERRVVSCDEDVPLVGGGFQLSAQVIKLIRVGPRGEKRNRDKRRITNFHHLSGRTAGELFEERGRA